MTPKESWLKRYGGFFTSNINVANYLLLLCALTIMAAALYIYSRPAIQRAELERVYNAPIIDNHGADDHSHTD
jgi:hypothetical protein